MPARQERVGARGLGLARSPAQVAACGCNPGKAGAGSTGAKRRACWLVIGDAFMLQGASAAQQALLGR